MTLMSGLGTKVSGNPKATIIIIVVLTVIFSYFGSSFQNNADPEAFNPDHELIKASEEAGDRFGNEEYNLLVLVKAHDKNLLEMEDMKALIELEDTLRSDEEIATAIVQSHNNPTGFASIADMLVLSLGLLNGRADMDSLLMVMNESLTQVAFLLENPNETNETKAAALITLLSSLSENLSAMQGDNGYAVPSFNKSMSSAALDLISLTYGPEPVPAFLSTLKEYDVNDAFLKTSGLTSSINASIALIMPYLPLLEGTPINQTNGAEILQGLKFALSTMEAGAKSIDEGIAGMYFGAIATLTRDFSESNGLKARGTIISINFNYSLDDEQKSSIENNVHDMIDEDGGELEYGVLGDKLINEEIQRTMDVSQMLLLVLVFVLIVLILFFTFRNIFDTVLTIGSLGMAIMWSYGISILLGLQGSIIAQVVPILLVGLGVDYGIHMTMRYREEKEKGSLNWKAISIAIATVGMALLMATITTSIGFMSNTISSLTILREFAIMVTIGIVSSFIIMTTFLPAVKLIVSDWRESSKKKKKSDFNSKTTEIKHNSKKHAVSIVTLGAKAGDRAPWAVLIILIIISVAAGYGASELDTVFDFRDFLPVETEAYDNYVYLVDEFQFGDQEFGEFYIIGEVTSPQVLKAMDETIANTVGNKQVIPGIPSRSIISVMKKYANPTSSTDFNRSFVETFSLSDQDRDGIPDTNIKTLFDILYNFEVSHDELTSVLHRNEDGNYDAALIQLRVSSDNLKKADKLVRELEDDASPLKDLVQTGSLEKVYVIGGPVVVNIVITEMNEGQIRSIIITILASFIVLTIVFLVLERSFTLGLITTIPVILVILWILGTMLLLGYNLNVMTITIASLTVGMGITYSIHISERFSEDLKHFENVGEACENTLRHTGMALAGAFLTTAGGFGILYFHKLPPLQQFGVMIALSITYSFLAAAYVLPTFLILWAKWRKKYLVNKGNEEGEKTRDKGEKGEHDKGIEVMKGEK